MLNVNSKTFIVYMVIQEWEEIPVHFKRQAQVGVLLFNKAITEVLVEYSNYNDVFLAKYVAKLPKNIEMNKYTIKLEEGKQLPFGSIYSLRLVELKTLKTYIKINLASSFIQPSKSLAKTFILFDKKPDKNLRLCVNN